MKTFNMLLLAAGACVANECTEQNKSPYEAHRQADRDASKAAADDTGRNARDREGQTLTPQDQKNTKDDVELTATIRKAITDDKEMSFNARNVKVITNEGVVTLRGPVADEGEKSAIERKAKSVAGVARVDNQLEVVKR